MYTAQTHLTLSDCQLVLLDDPGSGAALYYASPHPGGQQSSLSSVSVTASHDWHPAVLAMAKLLWRCNPGYWAPPAGVGYGVGDVDWDHAKMQSELIPSGGLSALIMWWLGVSHPLQIHHLR